MGVKVAASKPKSQRAKVPIHWTDLETAVECNAQTTESFLSLTTGQVVSITAGDPEAELLREKVGNTIEDYVRVEPASSREQYRWMEKFVGSVSDEGLRHRL